jgi:hypothetical protein
LAGFNFGKIDNVLNQVMDTDKIDIGRRMTIINPDGSHGETNAEEPIYHDIPCHISFNTTDNPSATGDTPAVIIGMTIHCPLYVDLLNADYVYAHKCDHKGEVLETYSGFVGFRTVHQSRQSVQLAMRRGV